MSLIFVVLAIIPHSVNDTALVKIWGHDSNPKKSGNQMETNHKWTVHPQIQNTYFPLACSAIYPTGGRFFSDFLKYILVVEMPAFSPDGTWIVGNR